MASPTPALFAPEIGPEGVWVPRRCRELIAQGALVAVNSSGGKDSQAMTIALARMVPPRQMVVVHAPLGEVEWPGTEAHIASTLPDEVPLLLARVASGKSLLDRIEERGMFPSSAARWCTSDFKRTPIERELRRYLKRHPEHAGRIVNAMGMRADESPSRAKLAPFSLNARNSKAGRAWYDWLPLHPLTAADSFALIARAGQRPHWAYAAGMSRLSCSFCILASRADLRRASELRPALYRQYVALEKRIGHTLSPDGTGLAQVIARGAAARGKAKRRCPPSSTRCASDAQIPLPGLNP